MRLKSWIDFMTSGQIYANTKSHRMGDLLDSVKDSSQARKSTPFYRIRTMFIISTLKAGLDLLRNSSTWSREFKN